MSPSAAAVDLERGLTQALPALPKPKATASASTLVPVGHWSLLRRRPSAEWRTRVAAALRARLVPALLLLLVSLGVLLAAAEVYARVASVSARVVRRGAAIGHGPSAAALFLLESAA